MDRGGWISGFVSAWTSRPAGGKSPSEGFLYQIADAFFQRLTDLPELELSREKVKVTLTEDVLEELLWAVPFAIGAEYITKKWSQKVFRKLQKSSARSP
ncbi:MAG: hypothetical protein HFG41_12450 [Coprococcus sp.]|nr:hypothetical protein [Coprococcus sp.]